jgi:hypothetical protein
MTTADTHAARLARIARAFDESMARLAARLDRADDEAAGRSPAAGAWSAAQVGWHVAAVNDMFAGLLESGPGVAPAPDGFAERSWPEVAAEVAARLDAPARVRPPEGVDRRTAIERLRASGDRLRGAILALTPERAACCLRSDIVGTISLYQVGEWATAHVIRHNRQAKRALGEA